MTRRIVAALCASLVLAGCSSTAGRPEGSPLPTAGRPEGSPLPVPAGSPVLEVYDVRDLARPDLAAEVRGAVDLSGWREGGSSVTAGDGILVVKAPPGTQDGVRAFLRGLRGK